MLSYAQKFPVGELTTCLKSIYCNLQKLQWKKHRHLFFPSYEKEMNKWSIVVRATIKIG